MSQALVLNEEYFPAIRLHATAMFAILNSHSRREDKQARVIGTLLGILQEGFIDVTDCFTVPHIEKTDEIFVAINKDYHKAMYTAHKRINRKEMIIGWYSTTFPQGPFVVDNSSLIHEFYSHECRDPIHLVVDTNLTGDNINVRAFVSEPMVIGEYALANMFQEVRVEVCLSESEINCIQQMLRPSPNSLTTPLLLAPLPSPTEQVLSSLSLLVSLLDKVSVYVQDVVDGKREADPQVGILLSDIMASSQVVSEEDFKKYFDDKVQDLLMMSYISTLTSSQIAVAEKLLMVL